MRGDLLEMIALLEEMYISDLKNGTHRKEALERMCQLDASSYPLDEWDYSLTYILDEKVHFTNYDELKAELQRLARN